MSPNGNLAYRFRVTFVYLAILVILGGLIRYLLAFHGHSVFPCARLLSPRSCVLLGPHTNTCPNERSTGPRGMIHLDHIEAEIQVLV